MNLHNNENYDKNIILYWKNVSFFYHFIMKSKTKHNIRVEIKLVIELINLPPVSIHSYKLIVHNNNIKFN